MQQEKNVPSTSKCKGRTMRTYMRTWTGSSLLPVSTGRATCSSINKGTPYKAGKQATTPLTEMVWLCKEIQSFCTQYTVYSKQAFIHKLAHAHMHVPMQDTHTHTCMHTRTHSRTLAHVRPHAHPLEHPFAHTCACTKMRV